MGLRGAVGKDINQCMRVCEESGLESESGWGGGGGEARSRVAREGGVRQWGNIMGKCA